MRTHKKAAPINSSDDSMGMSKHDLARKRQNLKVEIERLEKEARFDPLKKKPEIHERLAKLKAELGEN
ncbi:MAG: hypothetical protein M1530_03470 [Candidatus Marsarchaeota archaeon]|nr:hypothetical protein [Candidatus Marsarchaeota archaeon]